MADLLDVDSLLKGGFLRVVALEVYVVLGISNGVGRCWRMVAAKYEEARLAT